MTDYTQVKMIMKLFIKKIFILDGNIVQEKKAKKKK